MNDLVVWLTTAGEYGPLKQPRRCTVLGEMKSAADGGIIVALAIHPPFSDSNLSPPCIDESVVLVAAVFGRSYSLSTERVAAVLNFDSPLLVSVVRSLDPSTIPDRVFTRQNIQGLTRGALFRSEEEATRFCNRYQ